jgi:MoaA/NifB/PqqE/SkfB family radical SAM enzyme
MWSLFERPGVRLATSYYSMDAARHDAITGRRSHDRTLANIGEAVRRNIPLRVSVIQVHEHQAVDRAVAEMRALGVRHVGTDRLREIGRGVRETGTGPAELYGGCADGKLAVLPTGDVVPCLLSRWVVLGNVRTTRIGDLYEHSHEARIALVAATAASGEDARERAHRCSPDGDGGVCEQPTCLPHYEEA